MAVEEHVLWMVRGEQARAVHGIVRVWRGCRPPLSAKPPRHTQRSQTGMQEWSLCLNLFAVLHNQSLTHSAEPPNRKKLHNVSGSPVGQLSQSTVAIASIHFPLATRRSVQNSTCKLQLIVFRNGKLFPCTGNSSNLADDGKRRSVSTPVAFTKLDGCSPGSPVQPVTVALRHFSLGVDPTAAYWDFDLLDGHGGWRAEGCHITGSAHNTTTIHCAHHNNLAVLMDLKKVLSFPPYPGEFLHPVVYACTAVMLLCLFASIITYIVHHSKIWISRKGWHMLLNFCFHTALTFAVFAGGINRIKYPIICQTVGIVLHYSSLSTMLWLGVTARNIYKQVTKKPQQPQDGDPAPPHHSHNTNTHIRPKPQYRGRRIVRFYLVSAGVPFIICGITAAINIENYGSGELTPFCWMAWEPSLGAFYGPVAFIVLVTCVYFLCTIIQLRKHPERKYELKAASEEQQRLSDVHQGEPASGQCHGINPSIINNEHSFKAQLRTAAFTLFLFVATWTFAALAVGALAVSQGHFLDMIFSCLYISAGRFSVTLGLFILIHHCAKRDDVWHCWCACCPGRRPSNACHAHIHGHAHKLNINGDAHTHCHLDGGKPVHCACRAAGQNHVTCLTPVSPCCAALHTQQLLEDETSAHVLLHADHDGYRPAVRLHRCSKPVRTKTRRQRELALRVPLERTPQACTLAQRSPSSAHHHHMCCAKDELLDAGESFLCGKLAEDDLHHAHIELHARRQSLANQNGILKGNALYPSDSTGNIRTGPWRNETTV
ncbi:adhesion G protein-coupled receptor A1-like [Cyprinus carpio]|uniref:Adhesion G protein-coupled receptor A1-like n=1 Tax=Cyprinus carpio TaxID=7962 RepID=A0A9R0ACQ6_CYPCA|nr:adhesion G protein-coupled receptor A1-like [Cyprinus carpio]